MSEMKNPARFEQLRHRSQSSAFTSPAIDCKGSAQTMQTMALPTLPGTYCSSVLSSWPDTVCAAGRFKLLLFLVGSASVITCGGVASAATSDGFPNAATTGVPAGTVLSARTGVVRLSTANAVVSGLDVNGCVVVTAPNVVLEKSRIRGGGPGCWSLISNQSTGLIVRDVELDGGGNADLGGMSAQDFKLQRANIHRVGDGVRANGNLVIEDSWIHDLATAPGAHNDAIQMTQGSGTVIRRNRIENQLGQTSAIMIGADTGNVANVQIYGNLLAGGGYTVYGGARPPAGRTISNISITGNVFSRKFYPNSGAYGAMTATDNNAISVSGNTWEGSTQPVEAPRPPSLPSDTFPNASTTGVPAGTVLSARTGIVRLSTANAVVSGLDVNGCVVVTAPNVVLEKSRIRGGGPGCWSLISNQSTGLIVRDVELDGGGNADLGGMSAQDFKLQRANIHRVGDGVRANGNLVIEDSWIHDLATAPGAHNDAIQMTQGSGTVIRRNRIENQLGQTSAIMIGADTGNVANVQIYGNLLAGGGYTVYGGARPPTGRTISNIWINGNVFSRKFYPNSGAYGPMTATDDNAITVSGNTWEGSTQPVGAP